jgi:hypothetical protein
MIDFLRGRSLMQNCPIEKPTYLQSSMCSTETHLTKFEGRGLEMGKNIKNEDDIAIKFFSSVR